jgi:biopolymer transport protein ExbD
MLDGNFAACFGVCDVERFAMREKTMRGLMYSAAPATALVIVLVVWGMYQGMMHRTSTGVRVRVARDTCNCRSDRVIVLHVSSTGQLLINTDSVGRSELASHLKDIYETRAEKVIYLTADPDALFEQVADISNVAQNYVDEIRLVTPEAVGTPCCEIDCYNWGKQGFLTIPSYIPASMKREGDLVGTSDQSKLRRVPLCPDWSRYRSPRLHIPAGLR